MSEAQRGELRQEGRRQDGAVARVDESTDRADILDKLQDIGASCTRNRPARRNSR
ncbi:MAG: hypothetical protein R2832_14970 [Rhodothermales bacterium]